MPYIIVYNSKKNYNGIIMESLDAFSIKVQEDGDIILLMLLGLGGLGNYTSLASQLMRLLPGKSFDDGVYEATSGTIIHRRLYGELGCGSARQLKSRGKLSFSKIKT